MSNSDVDIDWSKTSWEGSRREQLRQWMKLSLRNRLLAVEEMADLSRHFSNMRAQGKFSSPSTPNVDAVQETGVAYHVGKPGTPKT
jgi:hypothetical protein